MYAFPFCFEEFVGRVDDSIGCVDVSIPHVDNSIGCFFGMGSAIFVPTGIDSIGDVVPLFMFAPIGIESKGGRLTGSFWRPKY